MKSESVSNEAVFESSRALLITQGTLNVVGTLLSVIIRKGQHSDLVELWTALTLISGIVTLAVNIPRKQWTDRWVSVVFLVNVGMVCGLLVSTQSVQAGQKIFWVPFEPHELSVLTIALLAPPEAWSGVLGILMFMSAAVIQFHSFSLETRAWIPHQAYFPPLAFGIFSIMLYLYRLHARKIQICAANLRAENRMTRKLTTTILAIRDLSNSPIQSLTIDAELLLRKYPDEERSLKRMEAAIIRLHELNRLLDKQVEDIEGSVEAASVDSQKILEELRGRS